MWERRKRKGPEKRNLMIKKGWKRIPDRSAISEQGKIRQASQTRLASELCKHTLRRHRRVRNFVNVHRIAQGCDGGGGRRRRRRASNVVEGVEGCG